MTYNILHDCVSLLGSVVAIVKNKDGVYTAIALGKVISLVLPGANKVVMEGKMAVQVLEVFNNNKVKRDRIVMCPNDCLAKCCPDTTDEKVPTPQSDISPLEKEDGVMNYGLRILQMRFLLLELNDTEKEGDAERSLLNWKILMLYFRSRCRGMKYAFEATRYITMTKALYTERTAHRIIHVQFVNYKGGLGTNCANDLKMEYMIRNNKVILKGLCGNKTLKAIQRNTSTAYSIQKVIENVASQTPVSPNSSAHTTELYLIYLEIML